MKICHSTFVKVKCFLLPFCLLPLMFLVFASCSEEETDIGVELQDPATFYSGISDSAFCVAYTVFDDSLLTSGTNAARVGCYSDPVFGNAEAALYTQISSPNGEGVAFDQNMHIDSVVLSMAVTEIFAPEASKSFHDLHFEVYQLAQSILTDSAYYSDCELPVSNRCFFNEVVRVEQTDTTIVNLKLADNFIPLLENQTYTTAESFVDALKGLRIRLVNDGTPQMATVNLAAAATRITVYFTFQSDEETTHREYELTIGHAATHFNQFKNHYIGPLATFNTNHGDSIDGSRYLYLSPMGGTNIKLGLGDFVQQFRAAHPYAVIHYAELLLPVADIAMSQKPASLAALKYNSSGLVLNVPDMYDAYTYQGFDGTYDQQTGCYRMRITQHLQRLLRDGVDYGTLVIINGRRSSAAHTVINGYDATATGNNPIRIRFVYSE